MIRALLLLLLLGAVGGAALVTANWHRWTQQPLNYAKEVVISVPQGAAADAVGRQLVREGVLEHQRFWWLLVRVSDHDRSLQAGTYRLPAALTPAELLTRLVNGQTLRYRLTVPEGWRFADMRQAMHEHEAIRSVLPQNEEAVMEALGLSQQAPEGLFFPDTYVFSAGTSDKRLLQQAHQRMQSVLQTLWQDRAPDLPLASPYEALVLASIVEKETALASERALIAGVFIARLRRGMRLQSDPTVIYGLQDEFDGNLRRRDLRQDTPYNTYTRPGLPPTPIALPGRKAIAAVLHPQATDALYFVATGDGSHHFSASYAEHRRAVARYQGGGG